MASWYDSNWTKRRIINLSPSTSTSDYQIKITLTSITLTGAQLTTGNANGNDIRFTHSDGTTLQDYWIESWTSSGTSVTATILVTVKTYGTSSIYMYYGNPTAISSSNSAIMTTGGTITEISGYRVHKFTNSGTFTILGRSLGVEYLVIAGGGGGGDNAGATGGAGGYRSSVIGESSGGGSLAEPILNLSAGAYTVTIGAGGLYGVVGAPDGRHSGANGENSVFTTITSIGGGGGHAGGWGQGNGYSGGSGGGSAAWNSSYTGGAGTPGQGYRGSNTSGSNNYSVGAGGGAGSAGADVGSGQFAARGIGVTSSIDGTPTMRASGGPTTGGYGSANPNTGDGGGYVSGNGGSGIVIVRYPMGTGTLATEELIPTAISMNLDKSACAGSCLVTATVVWQNLNASSITFRPAVIINGIVIQHTSDITILPYPGTTGSISITASLPSVGTYNVCPYPN